MRDARRRHLRITPPDPLPFRFARTVTIHASTFPVPRPRPGRVNSPQPNPGLAMTDGLRDMRPLSEIFWDILAILAVRCLEHYHGIDACDPDLAPREAHISVPMHELATVAAHHGAADGYRAAVDALCDLHRLRRQTSEDLRAHITVAAVPPLTDDVRVEFRLPLPRDTLARSAYRDSPAGPKAPGLDAWGLARPVPGTEPN